MSLKNYPRIYFELVTICILLSIGVSLSRAFLSFNSLDFDPSGIMVGAVWGSWFVLRIFIEIPGGLLVIKIGKRKLIIIGLLLSVIGTAFCALAQNNYVLIAGKAIWGLGVAFFFMFSTSIIFGIFDEKHRGSAVGAYFGLETAGNFLAAPIGGFLAEYIGFSNVFFISVIITIIALIVSAFSKELRKVDMMTTENATKIKIADAIAGFKNFTYLRKLHEYG